MRPGRTVKALDHAAVREYRCVHYLYTGKFLSTFHRRVLHDLAQGLYGIEDTCIVKAADIDSTRSYLQYIGTWNILHTIDRRHLAIGRPQRKALLVMRRADVQKRQEVMVVVVRPFTVMLRDDSPDAAADVHRLLSRQLHVTWCRIDDKSVMVHLLAGNRIYQLYFRTLAA